MRIIILLVTFALTQIATAQTPSELKAKLPQISGWTIDETVEVFNSDNLFERIDGAAPGYFLFNFKELTVFVYNQTGEGDNRPYITIQVYRHATGEDAFGIYASERPAESNFLTVGAEGYQEGPMLNFFVDDLYVKMESPSLDTGTISAIRQIARAFADGVNRHPVFPVQLQTLPATNKIPHTELYIPTSFLGHEFLNKAFTANYEASGKKYQLFIIDAGNAEQAKAMLTKYFQFTKQKSKLREGRLTIQDRYNGTLECQWKGRYIWGIVNDSKAAIKVDDILKETERKLSF